MSTLGEYRNRNTVTAMQVPYPDDTPGWGEVVRYIALYPEDGITVAADSTGPTGLNLHQRRKAVVFIEPGNWIVRGHDGVVVFDAGSFVDRYEDARPEAAPPAAGSIEAAAAEARRGS